MNTMENFDLFSKVGKLKDQSYRIINSIETLSYLELKGLANVINAYAENCPNEEISCSGFNEKTGYVYIALENGIQICSAFGKDVEYITYDPTGENEMFFDDFEKIVEYLD